MVADDPEIDISTSFKADITSFPDVEERIRRAIKCLVAVQKYPVKNLPEIGSAEEILYRPFVVRKKR